jgi:hypothetical protein
MLLNFLARYGIFLTIVVLDIVIMILGARRQRKVGAALSQFVSTVGWSDVRKPFLKFAAMRGMWNGRSVGLLFSPASRNTPAYVSTEIDTVLSGRFEIRGRGKKNFLNRPVMFFGPPKIDFFDPLDASRYLARSTDRSTVDSLLAKSGIRERLDANLIDDGVFTLRKGKLQIRRPLRIPRTRGFRLTFKTNPDLDRIRAVAAEEWRLISIVG